jgi:DNA transformation protein and related proteins
MELTDLPNVGPVLARSLSAVGIETPEQLREVGCEEAFMRIRTTVDPGACLHMLCGIEGAIEGIPDTRLHQATKDDLKRFYRSL